MAYIQVSGLTSGLAVPITIIGTASNIGVLVTQPTPNTAALASTTGYSNTLTGWSAQNGTIVDVRATSSDQYSTQTYVTVQIGSYSATWYLTTQNIPNNAPNPPPVFDNLIDQPTNTFVYSNVQQIVGLSTSATASVLGFGGSGSAGNTATIARSTSPSTDGNGVLIGASFTLSSITVSNGDYIQLRQLTSTSNTTTITSSVTIGAGLPIEWSVTTGLPSDTLVNSFTFNNITGANRSQDYASSVDAFGTAYVVSGLSAGVSVLVTLTSHTSPTTPRIQVNGGSIGTFPVSVSNGDQVRIWTLSGPNYGNVVETQIAVGTYSPLPWRITNKLTPDTTPDPVTFKNRINRAPSTLINSNAVSIAGIDEPVTISTTNGALISINGGTYQSSPRTVSAGDTVSLQLTSSATLSATRTTTVTIGTGFSTTWSVTTWAAAPTTELMVSQWYSKLAVIDQSTEERLEKKEDGLAIGTVLPVLKFQDGDFGNLDGDMSSRYPGWMECDGRSISAVTYWELFDVIGNQYGGNGAYNDITNVYSGSFNLPNYRNRKLAGVGPVDGNNAASAALVTYVGSDPTSASSGDSNLSGSSGGNWIVDTIDSQGQRPTEQVYDTSPNDVTGPFFNVGAIRTTGYSGIITEIDYNIGNDGYISATVGPLEESFTKIGRHTHFMLTAQETDEDISYIGWGVPSYGGAGTSGSGSGVDGRWIADRPSPADELYGAPYTSDQVTYGWWWRSPKSNTPNLDNSAGDHLAMIDTSATNATTDSYDPGTFGGALTHSHYLSETAFTDPKNSYAWGNVAGSGTVAGTFPVNYGNTINVRFNQSQLQISANQAVFQLESTKQVVPTVNLSPQKKIPLMNKYFRVKYVIKVY